MYFANYRRLVYLSQTDDPELLALARAAAARLGLAFEHRHVGLGELATSIGAFAEGAPIHVEPLTESIRDARGCPPARSSSRSGSKGRPPDGDPHRDLVARHPGPGASPATAAARRKVVLHPRFQVAIDKAASRAGKRAYNDYIEEWRRVARACGDDIEAEVTAETDRLETEYDKHRLAALIQSRRRRGRPGARAGPRRDAEAGERRRRGRRRRRRRRRPRRPNDRHRRRLGDARRRHRRRPAVRRSSASGSTRPAGSSSWRR